ncbi:MAG: HEPN domain-containing protein [Armatimonadetes bacterium]|nr:HEPN domain-containing protein [Armatimonadota bacterium]MDW8121406.1 HEPN domain-containing protein [Armatimonadota bacterium]
MQRTADWLREARAELQAAKDLFAHGHWFWCCFTCQQSAEKALKALGQHHRHPVFGHNLNLLVSALEDLQTIPEEVKRSCARLNRHSLPTRCPNAFDRSAPVDQFFRSDAEEALQDAERVVRFVEGIVGSP